MLHEHILFIHPIVHPIWKLLYNSIYLEIRDRFFPLNLIFDQFILNVEQSTVCIEQTSICLCYFDAEIYQNKSLTIPFAKTNNFGLPTYKQGFATRELTSTRFA